MAIAEHRDPDLSDDQHSGEPRRSPPTSAVVLAGGRSRRLGLDKALVRLGTNQPLIARVVELLSPLVAEVVVVSDDAGRLGALPARIVPDLYPGSGTLGGIYSGLVAARESHALVVGCDMPFLNQRIIAHLLGRERDYDLLLPRHGGGLLEPLHAVYSRSCQEPIRRSLEAGQYSAIGYLDQVRVRYVEESDLIQFDSDLRSFFNVNTPDDLRRATDLLSAGR